MTIPKKHYINLFIHLLVWSFFCVLTIIYMQDWLSNEVGAAAGSLTIYSYSILYIAIFAVAVYTNVYFLTPKYYAKSQFYKYGFYLLCLILMLCAFKMMMDILYIDLYVPELEKYEWVATFGHFLSISPSLLFFVSISFWFGLSEMRKNILVAEKYDEQKIGSEETDDNQGDNVSITIKSDGNVSILKVNHIKYIEGLKQYVKIHTIEDRFIVLDSLKNLEEQLGTENFMRVHRSYIVSKKYVTSLSSNFLIVGGEQIPVGRKYKNVVTTFKGKLP